MPTDIETYRAFVADALSRSRGSAEGIVFGNRGTEHARIVMEAIIGDTKASLRVLTGSLVASVHSPLAFRELLARRPDARVRVIVDRLTSLEGSALEQLAHWIGAHEDAALRVRRVAQTAEPHMAIADDRLLRIETDHGSRAAVVALNKPDVCRSHARRFDSLWDRSGPDLGLEDLGLSRSSQNGNVALVEPPRSN